ncbi:hypothetical protein ABZ894_22975 [Nocardia beijingensis]|uniref:SCO4402 family protein n=1 Tax=Nocardia beijingensis TaxID=95162 RepID=UPI0033C98C3A
MSEVRYPDLRRYVINAVAALSDLQYQQRVWIERNNPRENYYDDLDTNIHTLYDDYRILPEPESALDDILVDGDEVERLRTLGRVLGPIIDELGDAPDTQYLSHPNWPAVIRAAGTSLSALVLAGGL